MPVVGRNEPCPCGSGLKYKRCCARKHEEDGRRVHAAQAVGSAGMDALAEFLFKTYGHRLRDEAWPLFAMDDREIDAEDPEFGQMFMPWAIFQWQADGHPPARAWLERAEAHRDDPDMAVWAEACLQSPFTFLEVQAVEPGRGLDAIDLLTGQRMFIHDRSLSRGVRQWHLLFGKPVTWRGLTFIEGVGPTPFDPGIRTEAVEKMFAALRRERTRRGNPGDGALDDLGPIRAYRELLRHNRARMTPTLQNTDGHPLVLCKTTWRILDAPTLTEALGGIDGLGPVEEAGTSRVWTWTRPGNPKHPDWDNTVIGRLEMDGPELLLETNSVEREADLRGRLDLACRFLIEYVSTDRRDSTDLDALRQSLPQGEEPDEATTEAIPPEVEREVVERFLEKHYAAWPDTPLPALDGKTPRQAAKTKAGRERLERLIREFEFRQPTGPVQYDFNRLRRELGLSS